MSDEAGSINETSTPTDLTSNNFDSAIAYGGSLKLSEDITTASKADISKDTTLDLYGHTLTFSNGSDEYGILVKPGATLTITDTSGTTGSIKKVIGTNDNDLPHPVILIGTEDKNATNTEMATLNLQKCNIQTIADGESSKAGYGVYAANYSQVTAGKDVEIIAGYSAISGNGNNQGASITITGGEYTSETSAAIFFPSTTKLDVTGGTFIGKTGFDIRAGTVTISDAVISLNKTEPIDETGTSGPSSWGMGIAVLDHKAYAKDNSGGYLDINVFINNVKFEGDENFDIYVGKHPLDTTVKSSEGTKFVQNNEKTLHDINIVVNKVDFEGKGLYLYGANDVEITNCTFKNIDTSADSDEKNVNAIYLQDCRGSIIIGGGEGRGNTIENVSKTNESGPNYGRGIFIYNCDYDYIEISHNKISDIAFNAIQMTCHNISEMSEIYIAGNTITKWDVDDDSIRTKYTSDYAGGRALRIDVQNSYLATIINNTFSKTYEDGIDFVTGLGNGTNTGYDIGNVLKLNAKSVNNGDKCIVILDLDGNKLDGDILDYANDSDHVILQVDGKAKFSNDPEKLLKMDGTDVKLENLVENYKLNPTDGGYTFHPTGTLKYVTGYTDFSRDDAAMQSGYYLPFRITFDKSVTDLTKLSVTLRGHNETIAGYANLDSQTKGSEYMDVVFFIGSLSTIGITVDTNADDNMPGVTYVIYLDGLDLEQSVITAPLVDHGADGNEDKVVTPDDYEVEMSLFYSDVFVLNVTAHDLIQHYNGKNELGYWVGVAIPVPAGINISNAKYSFSDKPIDSSKITESLNNSDLYSIGDKNYVCFYPNVDADDVKRFIAVDWDGSDDSAPPLYYFVNFDVTYTSDEFKPAPLVDHATEPGKEIKLEEYSVKVGTAGITTLYLTAKDVPNHVNGANTSGYWVGIGFKAPADADFKNAEIVTGWGRPYASIVSGNYTEGGFDSYFTVGDDTYFTTYYNVGSSKYQKQAYIMIYWNGFESTTVSDNDRPDIYIIDFTNVSKKSSSGSGGGVPVTPPVTPEEPKEPIIPDSKGNAEIKVDEEKADKLVQETVTSGSKTLELIDKDSIEGMVTSVTVAVEGLKTISDKIENNQNINSVSIATSAGEVIIEKDVLSDIIENANAETIVVEVVDAKDQLNEEQKKVVGDNPVYDINIRAGSEYITNFNGNSITISIPYELQPGEDPNNIVVYHLKDDGTVEKMKGTYKDGKVSFETNHLSKFVIAYEAQEPVTPDNPDKPTKEDNDNTIYYIIAAIVVILIIVALAYYFLKKKQ
ncbi:right-handed parallel beta-helix repeat-containing protein [Candidatus Methanomassiliicoccus intestinalis]|uniref:right-handed parallel beta-helix repeat-containing protein n=1 Tax=Candidatus Methanomassiliicoccus intestinalis TaxID=1406512 RepID=UPI0037DC3F6F